MPRKPGSSTFTKGYARVPVAVPASFYGVVRSLGLTQRDCQKSTALRRWVERNKNTKYVPPELLTAWGIRASEY
jgi:hypothetical protein